MTPGPELGLTFAILFALGVAVTGITHMAIADWLDRRADRRDERRPPPP